MEDVSELGFLASWVLNAMFNPVQPCESKGFTPWS
jgi:hypothetical protein